MATSPRPPSAAIFVRLGFTSDSVFGSGRTQNVSPTSLRPTIRIVAAAEGGIRAPRRRPRGKVELRVGFLLSVAVDDANVAPSDEGHGGRRRGEGELELSVSDGRDDEDAGSGVGSELGLGGTAPGPSSKRAWAVARVAWPHRSTSAPLGVNQRRS